MPPKAFVLLAIVAATTSAFPADGVFNRQTAFPVTSGPAFTAPGVATFNNYTAQGKTVCGPLAGANGAFGAAAGSISPDVRRGACTVNPADPTPSTANCDGQAPIATYIAPSCPAAYCGPAPQCYRVTNRGPIGGDGDCDDDDDGTGNAITVQIIDVCPAEHAQNFCKTLVPADQRCGDPATNSLDLDQAAYRALAGRPFRDGLPNLSILIAPAPCP